MTHDQLSIDVKRCYSRRNIAKFDHHFRRGEGEHECRLGEKGPHESSEMESGS